MKIKGTSFSAMLLSMLLVGCAGERAMQNALPSAEQRQAALQEVLRTGSPEEKKKALQAVLNSARAEDAAKRKPGEPPVVYIGPPLSKGASAEERLAAFKELYALGEDVDATDEFYYTGLGYACKLNDRASVDEILKLKPNLMRGKHEDDDEECHCMDWMFPPGYVKVALENGHRELALYLLSRGAAPVGVPWCLEHDDLPMLKALLAAGGSLREGMEDVPLIISAKSVEMVRYLHRKGSRCTDATEYLYMLRWVREKDEAQARETFVEAGLITPKDVENFDRGGIPKLYSVGNPPSYLQPYPDDWQPKAAARRMFNDLCGADAAAQDATVPRILSRPLSKDEKNGYYSSRAGTLCAALIIVGDERFVAQLQKLSPARREFARKLLEKGLYGKDHLPDILAAHPRTCRLLGLRSPDSSPCESDAEEV